MDIFLQNFPQNRSTCSEAEQFTRKWIREKGIEKKDTCFMCNRCLGYEAHGEINSFLHPGTLSTAAYRGTGPAGAQSVPFAFLQTDPCNR